MRTPRCRAQHLAWSATAALPLSLARLRRGIIGLLAAIVWGTLLSQAMFYDQLPRTTLITIVPALELFGKPFAGLHLYREGMTYGLAQSLRMVAVTLAGLAVCLSISPERIELAAAGATARARRTGLHDHVGAAIFAASAG